MSIFYKLLQLNQNQIPLEDFFTEIFTYLLKSNPSLLCDWLKKFNISDIEPESIMMGTQQSFDPLDEHFSGSRPDIYIELSNGNRNELIFIECKIGSNEGRDQLKRYAEQLDNINSIDRRVLIYITRDYDQKDSISIFKDCKNKSKLKFKQFRWYENYQLLKEYSRNVDDNLVEETLRFMEEYDLSGDNRFSSVDVLALNNFSRVRKMMDETMYGQVSEKFKEIAGGVTQKSTCLTQLKDFNRYTYFQRQTKNYEFGVLLGYWMNDSKITDYPKVGFYVEVSPNSEHRYAIIEAMKEIVNNSDKWQGYGLNEAKSWSGIAQNLSIDKFMGEEDHIKAIQNYFIGLLEELNEIKKNYPHLPWKVPP